MADKNDSMEFDTPPLPPVSTVSAADKARQFPDAVKINSEEEAKQAKELATKVGRLAVGEAVAGATNKISHDVADTVASIIESDNARLKDFRIVMEVFLRPVWLLAKALEMISGAGEKQANGMQVQAADVIEKLTGDSRLKDALGQEEKGKPAADATKEKPKTSKISSSEKIFQERERESNADFKAATGLSDQKAGNER